MVVIWVAVGGRKDLTAAILGAITLEWMFLWLTTSGNPEYAQIVMGGILILVMLVAPEGIFIFLGNRLGKLFARSAAIISRKEDS